MSSSLPPRPEDDRWEQEDEEDLAAVRAAIAELQAGDPGRPLEEVIEELRRQHF